MADPIRALRDHLIRALAWEEAHVAFDRAAHGLPSNLRAARPAGFEHSAWQLIEHMRLAQKDLLDFCLNAEYAHALTFPDDYWPREHAPSDADWTRSLADFRADRAALQRLVRDPSIDLFVSVPTGDAGQTYLRAILLVIDHNAYHLAQLVALRRALGAWTQGSA